MKGIFANRTKKSWQSERGNAALVAVMFLAFGALTVLTIMASSSMRQTRNLEKSRSKLHEKWQARSGVNVLAQIVSRDAPEQISEDVRFARNECGVDVNLSIFDTEDVRGGSNPAVRFEGTEIVCTGADRTSSIFGTFSSWRDARIPIFEKKGREQFGLDAENVRIIQLDEIYRRNLTDSDIAYAVRYIVEAKFGNYRTRTNGEMILGTRLPSCGTSVSLEIVPATVVRGGEVEMRITYSNANNLKIYNSAQTLMFEKSVAEQSSPETYIHRFSPSGTDTYYVKVSSASGCQATTASVTVTVTEPPQICPRVVDFSASSLEINSGETVTLSWNVQDAAVVTFENSPVVAVGSQSFTLMADRTFTLTAQDTANNCPVTRQITVRVRIVPPSCSFSTPQISFSANPTSIAIGASSTLAWNIAGLETSGTARITGPNGFEQIIGASGSQSVSPPTTPGDYTYTLVAENICPDGTRLTAMATVVISVRACPPPVIAAFTVNPSTVTQGGNQMITLSWAIDGTADSVSISNGVGGNLPATGSVEIPQPNVTTSYTITVIGCGQTRTEQRTVQVNSQPPCVVQRLGDDFNVAISYKYEPLGVYVNKFRVPKQSPILRWVAINALPDSVRINGQSVPPKGEMLLNNLSAGEFTYIITATSLDGTSTKSDFVNISTEGGAAGQGAGVITASPNPLVFGNPLTIYDSSVGTQTYNSNDYGYPSPNLNGTISNYGSLEKYGFWQYGSNQEPYFGNYVYLQTIPQENCPIIKMFSASPYVVNQQGVPTRLSWTVENGNNIFIDGIGDVTGRQYVDIVSPNVDTDYRMTVTSSNGCTDVRTARLIVRQKGWTVYAAGSAGGGLVTGNFSGTITTPENGNIQINLRGSGLIVGGSPSSGGISRIQVFNGDNVIYDGVPTPTFDEYGILVYQTEILTPACPSTIHMRVFYSLSYCPFFGACDISNGVVDTRQPNGYPAQYTTTNGVLIHSNSSQGVFPINDISPIDVLNLQLTGFY